MSPAAHLSVSLFALLASTSVASAATITVAADGTGDYTLLQDAVDAALHGDEIRVLAGQYDTISLTDKGLFIYGDVEDDAAAEVVIGDVSLTGAAAGLNLFDVTVSGGITVSGADLFMGWVNMENGGGTTGDPAIRVQDGRLAMDGCTVSGWYAADSVIEADASGVGIANSYFSGSESGTGSVVRAVASGVEISRTTFTGNVSGGNGGAVSIFEGFLVLENSFLSQNTSGRLGGHVHVEAADFASFDSNVFVSGGAVMGGGALAVEGVRSVLMDGLKFFKNVTGPGLGGAVFTGGNSSVRGRDLEFHGNAGGWGGHMFVQDGSVRLVRTKMSQGSAQKGGALAISGGHVAVSNAMIWLQKPAEEGGAVYMDGGGLAMRFVSMYSNPSGETGQIALTGGEANLEALLVLVRDAGPIFSNEGNGTMVVRESAVFPPQEAIATGNVLLARSTMVADPLFMAPEEGDFAIRVGSAGLDTFFWHEPDLDGTEADMGAYGGLLAWPLPDADGDGYVYGRDCDDSDPTVNEAAEEIWYDGVDQDCDGWSDYDADMDGFDSDQYGGEDCDDDDPTIYPGAVEFPGDGIDSDCDGLDDTVEENPSTSPLTVENSSKGCSSVPTAPFGLAGLAGLALLGLVRRRQPEA